MATLTAKAPFRADQVGSLMRPAALIEARDEFEAGKRSAEDLRRAEDDAVRAVVAKQEALGFQAVSDGEFRRTSWNRDFLLRFENIVLGPGRIKLGTEQKTPTSTAVTGKVSRPQPIFVEHFAFLRSVANATPKLTMPSPTIVHFRGGRESIDRTAYPELDAFFADLAAAYREEIADLAAAGCRYLQIDDVNFAYLCDTDVMAQLRAAGDDPQTLPHIYAQLINSALAGRPDDMLVGMHVCRGNGPTGWATGGYEPVAETIFNEIDVDTYFLEYDGPRAGGFEPLRFLPKGKNVVLGLVSTKTAALESKDDLKRRIDEAAKFAPLDQLAISPQCGFASASGKSGNRRMTEDEQFAKLQRVVEVAREVWG
jgi:5-methyltetrahydropteroyltriglutamate--homocysteine methyltransferase